MFITSFLCSTTGTRSCKLPYLNLLVTKVTFPLMTLLTIDFNRYWDKLFGTYKSPADVVEFNGGVWRIACVCIPHVWCSQKYENFNKVDISQESDYLRMAPIRSLLISAYTIFISAWVRIKLQGNDKSCFRSNCVNVYTGCTLYTTFCRYFCVAIKKYITYANLILWK
jgi:hypothetical protein